MGGYKICPQFLERICLNFFTHLFFNLSKTFVFSPNFYWSFREIQARLQNKTHLMHPSLLFSVFQGVVYPAVNLSVELQLICLRHRQ